MSTRWPSPWVDVLTYLDGIGYRELYLRTRPPVPGRATSSPQPGPPLDRLTAVASPRETAPTAGRDAGQTPDLEILAGEASVCRACRLCERRKSVVFGSGDPRADLMLIGEGPGAEEDRQGLPFVGPAGALLTRILKAIELEREDVYIANMVKCRPPGNRDPQPDEVAACRRFLDGQIDHVRPRVLVALGRVAAQALLGTTDSLGRLRGRWHQVRGVPTRVTYHPAALLRNTSFKRPTWEDMQIIRDRLREGDS